MRAAVAIIFGLSVMLVLVAEHELSQDTDARNSEATVYEDPGGLGAAVDFCMRLNDVHGVTSCVAKYEQNPRTIDLVMAIEPREMKTVCNMFVGRTRGHRKRLFRDGWRLRVITPRVDWTNGDADLATTTCWF